MNRRDLGRVIGGAALTAASYRRVSGANDKLGMALIGSGRRGREVMAAFLKTGQAELRAICDVYDVQRQRALDALARTGEKPFQCATHEEALTHPGIDAVLIAAPDHLHLSLGCAALAAGKHVYLEKPTTHRFGEQKQLREAVRSSGKVLQCGTQQRSGAHYQRAKEEIFNQGKLGKVAIVRAYWSNFPWQARHIVPAPKPASLDWDRFLGPAPKRPYDTARYDSWRCFHDYGNGLLADILTHWADVAQWMMGETEPASAVTLGGIYQLNDGRDNPDTVNAILQYKGGWNLSFESSVLPLSDERPGVVFLGTAGTLEITRTEYRFTPKKGERVEVRASGPLEIAHAANFIKAVRDGGAPSAPVEVGIQACNPVHLALAAYWKKSRVEWGSLA
jgi:predicted dehydrogenase